MNGLIYNQHHIPRDEHRYGFRSSAKVGCGWVATHNALRLMGYKTDIDRLIRYYEWQLPLIHGNAGTSFWAPAVCFRNWGFPVEIVLDRKRFDDAAKAADIIHILIPDEKQAEVYNRDIAPFMTAGKALSFSHGFNIHFKQIVPPADVDVFMVAPKSPGHSFRKAVQQGTGVPGLVAVEQDATGNCKNVALAFARAVG